MNERTGITHAREWWNKVAGSAELVHNGPPWMRAGINLNPQHFETHDQWCGVSASQNGQEAENE